MAEKDATKAAMRTSKRRVNKPQAVRGYLAAYPDADNLEVQAARAIVKEIQEV